MGVGLILSMGGLTSCSAQPPDPATEALLKQFLLEFVPIQPGTDGFPAEFTFGNDTGPPTERPARTIKLTRPFAIAKYEMPQNLYQAVMGANPSRWKGPRNSVEMITYADAEAFCRKATALLRAAKLLDGDLELRLPTEIEWEYCCRAGTTTRYSFGDETRRADDPPKKLSILDEYAWYNGNAAGNDPPVGALKPNPWGLYDMHGYLREFTASAWTEELSAVTEQPVTQPIGSIVVRGGSWKDAAEQLTSSSRMSWGPKTPDDAVGFRCVRVQVGR